MKIKWPKLLLSFFVTFAAAAIGQVFTYKEISTWYVGLHKAPFNPPNWVFGPVWTILYTLMAISLYIIWEKKVSEKKKQLKVEAIGAFFVQLALNTGWSLIFFGAHAPWLAFGEIVVLWLFIVVTINLFWQFSRAAALLLVPYLLWVSFASLLNLFVAVLNP